MYSSVNQNNFNEISQSDSYSINDKLSISIKAILKLSDLHAYDSFHNELNSKTFVYNKYDDDVILISENSLMLCSIDDISHNNLQYLSPEQTGRINRVTDYRTDLYSFGVVLFKLFTKKYPFEFQDPLQIIHAHIAKIAPLASELNSSIPKHLSLIIEKLLTKDPDDRYQSANGIYHDLKSVLEQLNTNSFKDFELGIHDISHRPNIPQKLYGREKEIKILINSFEKVITKNKKEIVSIGGYSGIGKSSLIASLNKPMNKNSIYFLNGKYQQSKNNIPYYGLIKALQEYISYILLEKENYIEDFKNIMKEKVGDNIKLICEMIPELSYIITEDIVLADLNPVESQNRFNITFLNFIRLIFKFEKNIVLCLDDLQWADSATIEILQNIIEDNSINSILILLSFRSNEVKKSHALSLMFKDLKNKKIAYTNLEIEALQNVDVNNIVSDTLNISTLKSKELATLITQKTSGNPFFTKKFILNLYDEKLLYIDKKMMQWSWNLEKIKEKNITENVASLILKKVSTLNKDTKEILKFMVCLSNKSVNIITNILNIDEQKIQIVIKQCIEAEILLPIIRKNEKDVYYKFSHDKVSEAISSLLSIEEKQKFNQKVGNYILDSIKNEKELEDRIFELTDHLNLGYSQVTQEIKKEQLVQLNFKAAKKAKEANAYNNSIGYLNKIFELITEEQRWKDHYSFSIKVYTLLSEVYYLNSDFKNAKICFKKVKKNVIYSKDAIEICQIQIYSLNAQNKMEESLNLGLDILNQFEIVLPKEDDINVYYPTLFTMYDSDNIDELVNFNDNGSAEQINILNILNSIMSPAYLAKPILYPKICYMAVKMCIENGICAASANVFSVHALLLCGCFNKYEEGFAFSKLSQKIVEKSESTKYSCKVEMISNACVVHWNKNINETLGPLKKSILIGIDNGDLEYSCYSAMYYCLYSLLSGKNIDELLLEFNTYLDLMKELKQEYQIHYLSIWNQFLINLKVHTSNPLNLEGEIFSEKKMLPILKQSNNISTLYCYYLAKAMLGLYFDDTLAAYTNIQKAKEYLEVVASLYHFNEFYFYESLIVYNYFKEYKDLSKDDVQIVLQNNCLYYEKLLETSYKNNSYKFNFIKALQLSLNKENKAWDYYELACKESLDEDFIHVNVLCNLVTASFWFESNMKEFAYTYIQKAYNSLNSWGANILIENLIKKHQDYFNKSSNNINNINNINLANFDFESVMKASQAISEEISLEELLNKIMQIIIENSGSQRGVLLLQDNNELVIEACYDISTKYKKDDFNTLIEMPKNIINYVKRFIQPVIFSALSNEQLFANDEYIINNNPKSAFCLPIVYKKDLLGILYVENRDIHNLYSEEKIEFLKLLSQQAAISIDHAKLFKQTIDYSNTLEETVNKKTKELRTAVEELRIFATVDSMTGLNNRRYFFELANSMFKKAYAKKKSLHAFILDIDYFKIINDTYGHNIGDQTIKAFADILSLYNSNNCIIGRLGGDEFVILALEYSDKNINILIDHIKQNVLKIEFDNSNVDIKISASIGYATLTENIHTLDDLIIEADRQMYENKNIGRNTKKLRSRV
jgi:diguanylate cyclase (GGDEF)-like protein